MLGETTGARGGGPGLLERTVADLVGQPVDFYVRVNFDGFRQVIDRIGGVDVDVPRAIDDPTYPDHAYGYDPLYIPAGRVHMDGELALKYARTRHPDNDYGRARRQQQLIRAIAGRLQDPRQWPALIPRLPGLIWALPQAVDTDLSPLQMIGMGIMLARASEDGRQLVVDGSLGREATDAVYGWVLIPDVPRVRAAVAETLGAE
jgi:LCP family protein required for cell wall assembly